MLPNIIVFLIILSILVFIHEIGHFLAAKKMGIKVEEFGFGYPPRVWGRKIKGTIYSLNWIPFGGFVRILGQERLERKKWPLRLRQQAFFAQGRKAKILVLIAGIVGNFILGVVCFSIIYAKIGIPRPLGYVKLLEVIPNSPAAQVGLKKDDHILSLNNKKVVLVKDFVKQVEQYKGQEISLETDKEILRLIPRENPPENEGRIGVAITDTELKFYPWWQMPFWGCIEGTKEALGWSWMIVKGLFLTVKQLFSGIAPEVAGPVGIFQLTTAAAKEGLLSLIQFTGILSINLAVLNLLPFPALDGGHLAFVFLGRLISEKKREKVEHVINAAGFIFLISLMVLVTVNDLVRLLKTVNFANIPLLQPFFK